MNKIRVMVCTIFVLAVTTLLGGVVLTYAAPSDTPATDNSQAAAQKEAAAAKARAIKAADLKKRQDARKRLMDAIGAKQGQAPANAGQGGTQ